MAARRDIDGGWAWMVLVGAFFCMSLNGGCCYSMGIITEALLELYHQDLTLTSTVGSIVGGAQCCIGPVAGILCKHVGCRACTITGGVVAAVGLVGASTASSIIGILLCGVVTGSGFGLGLVACNVMLAQYFHRLRPVAAGIGMTGAGVGIFAGPPLVRFLIDSYGLKGTFLILAGVSGHLCVIGCLFRPPHTAKDTRITPKSYTRRIKEKLRNCSGTVNKGGRCTVLRNPGYLFYQASLFLWALAESAALVHLPNYCIKQGTSKMATALLYSAIGIGSTVSRLFTGFAASDPNVDIISLHVGQIGVAGVVTVLFPLYSSTYGGQVVFAGAIGVYTSGVNSLFNPLNVQLLGLDDFPTGYGLGQLTQGLGYLLGSPIAAKIVDSGATYTESYIFAGCVYLLSSMFALMIALVHSADDKCGLRGFTSVLDVTMDVDILDTRKENSDQECPPADSGDNEEELELLRRGSASALNVTMDKDTPDTGREFIGQEVPPGDT